MTDSDRNAWNAILRGLLRTDFGRAVDGDAILHRARLESCRRLRRQITWIWSLAAVLLLGIGLLGLHLGSETAMGRASLAGLPGPAGPTTLPTTPLEGHRP